MVEPSDPVERGTGRGEAASDERTEPAADSAELAQLDAPTLALVRGTQAGDARSRELLCARVLPRIRRIVALRLGKRLRELCEVDDIVHESVLLALKGIGRFEPRGSGSFDVWLSTIVLNTVRSQARFFGADKRVLVGPAAGGDDAVSLGAKLLPGAATSPSVRAMGRELDADVEDCLLALSERERDVVAWRGLSELSWAEIAVELDTTQTAARTMYSRAIRQLLTALADRGWDLESRDGVA